MLGLVSGLLLPVMYIVIRNYITDTIGQSSAGQWEAMNRISSYYLLFINSIITLYFLPRFSELHSKSAIISEVWTFYRSVLPLVLLVGGLLYVFREYIVSFVLSSSFTEVPSLFLWQLLGDMLRVLALVVTFRLLAKRMLFQMVILELVFIVILYFSSLFFIDSSGIIGATKAHFVSYLVYFMLAIILFQLSLRKQES